jgi:hypothetical protein
MLILLVVVVGLAEPFVECDRAVQDDGADPLVGHNPVLAPLAEGALADPEGLGGFVLGPCEAVS